MSNEHLLNTPRGVSSKESAGLGGAGHLLNFQGTDNIEAILTAQSYYNTDDMLGFSIPAAEHSTITSWGRENEKDAYANMLAQFAKPNSLVAVVSDSYDLFNAIENMWGKELKEQIEKSGGTLVIRPDSGEPVAIVKKCLELLEQCFGVTLNSKGFKVLPSCVRLIQGDGINAQSLQAIIDMMLENQYSLDNIAFGMGGGLLQQINRDTMQWAMKCSSVTVDGADRDVFKDPITSKAKQSKKGRLAVYKDNSTYVTCRVSELPKGKHNLLQRVYSCSEGSIFQNTLSWEEVKNNVVNS